MDKVWTGAAGLWTVVSLVVFTLGLGRWHGGLINGSCFFAGLAVMFYVCSWTWRRLIDDYYWIGVSLATAAGMAVYLNLSWMLAAVGVPMETTGTLLTLPERFWMGLIMLCWAALYCPALSQALKKSNRDNR